MTIEEEARGGKDAKGRVSVVWRDGKPHLTMHGRIRNMVTFGTLGEEVHGIQAEQQPPRDRR